MECRLLVGGRSHQHAQPESVPQLSRETQRQDDPCARACQRAWLFRVFVISSILCQVAASKTLTSMSALSAFDFHCHSLCSDGALTPHALIALAAERGLQQLAITDHDTTLAYTRQLADQARAAKITLISGCELSCVWQRRSIHIVGLNMDLAHPVFVQAMVEQAKARDRRAEKIIQALQRLGFSVSQEQIQAIAGQSMVGRPHFAEHLVRTKQMPSIGAAFKRALGAGKPGDIKADWPTLESVVGWISAAGGVAVVAHPFKYKMTLTKLRSLLEDFVELGGQGIEVITGHQQPNHTRTLTDLAQRFDLAASAGSDFHRPGQPWAELGRASALPERCTPIWKLWSA